LYRSGRRLQAENPIAADGKNFAEKAGLVAIKGLFMLQKIGGNTPDRELP
jgi:hypothetical protein